MKFFTFLGYLILGSVLLFVIDVAANLVTPQVKRWLDSALKGNRQDPANPNYPPTTEVGYRRTP